MAVQTDLCSVDDKRLVKSKENNPKESLQVSAVNDQKGDPKNTDIKTVEMQPQMSLDVVKSIKSSAVGGKVDIVESKNVIIGDNTYFNGPVKIKKIKKKAVSLKNSSTVENENGDVTTTCDIRDSTAVKRFQIRRWYLKIVGLYVVTLSVLLAILYNRVSSDFNGDTPLSTSDHASGNANILDSFYDNLNLIAIAIVVTPLALLLIANALLSFHNSAINMKKREVDDLEEEYDDLMRPVKRVKTAVITPENLRIVSRTVWHAQPVVMKLDKIRQPVPWAIIAHTATGGCNTQSECVRHVRVIQMYHKDSKDWDDIGYNFLVGGDGAAYCGRGWDYIGAHTLGYNRLSIGIGFIGTFNNYPPPKRQLEACKKLLKRGVALGKLAKDYKLFAHRQLWATHSPGDKLFDIIKEWPHFVKEFNDISELLPGY